MNCSLPRIDHSSHRWSRFIRRLTLITAFTCGAVGAVAQTTLGISSLAGQANSTGTADGTGGAARFNFPQGVVMDASGNIYVADASNHVIRRVTPAGVVATIAGVAGTQGTADGEGNTLTGGAVTASGPARFRGPQGLALNGNTLYVADSLNHTIRAINLAVNPVVVSTYAGSAGVSGSAGSNATPVAVGAAGFNVPVGLRFANNTLWVADSTNHSIRRIDTGTNMVSTIAGPDGSTGNAPGTSGNVNATGPAARFNTPYDVAVDNTNLYVADRGNHSIRVITIATGAVNVLAGTGSAGSANATGASASFFNPGALIVDSDGTAAATVMYVADTSNNMIRSVTLPGAVVGTAAGSTTGGFADGLGAAARFSAPAGLAFNAARTSFAIADTGGQLIRWAAPTVAPAITSANNTTFTHGVANTFTFTATGSPAPTFSVTGGSLPAGVTLTSAGVLSGTPLASGSFPITVEASNGVGTAATQAFTLTVNQAPQFTTQPANQSVALGQSVSFTVVAAGSPAPTYQWQRFRVGDSTFSNLSDDGTYSGTTTATLTINSVATQMGSDLYRAVAANGNGTANSNVAQLSHALGSVFTTFAGVAGASGATDGTGNGARFNGPNAVAVDSSGNIYVADASNQVIRKITSAGVVTTIAGQAGAPGSADGFQSAARFNTPSGVALDSTGNVYVADAGNHTIRMISPIGSVTTLAGSAGSIGTTDGAGSSARFAFPSGIAVDAAGTLYVADTLNGTIRKLVPGGGTYTVSTFVSTAVGLSLPNSVAVDSSFNVYVADSRNHVIRKVTPGGTVSVLAGAVGSAGTTDGNGGAARFNSPHSLAVDSSGTVWVANTFGHTIRRISSTGDVSTVGGFGGASGSADGAGSTARFNHPYGIAIDASGNIYVADTFNHTIRRSSTISAPAISTQPQNQNVAAGGLISFSVAASGSPTPSFQWQRQPAGASDFTSLNNDSTYNGVNTSVLVITGVTAGMSGDKFRAVATNQVEPAATSGEATLTVVTPPVFTSASSATFRAGRSNTFTVTTNSTPAATFTAAGLPSWATLNASTGVLTGTPPDTSGSPFTITITANNGTGPSTAVTQAFTLTVEPSQVPPSITTQPQAATANVGDNVTFTVAASGTAPLTYQWRKDGVALNGATSATLVIPNVQASSGGAYSVVVSNAFGAATSNLAALVVNTPPVFFAQPQTQTVLSGGTVTFSAGVSGASGLTYQWRRNGVAIPGATFSSHTVLNASATEAGYYDVVITNALGSVTSSIAQLNVVTAPVAPSFTLHPASRTVVAGGSVTLAASATGAPAPSYQWRRNGINIPGATSATLTLTNVTAADAANYDVVATNSVTSSTSAVGALRVIARSHAGIYFGAAANSAGNFALYVREDNSAVFLGAFTTNNTAIAATNLAVGDNGQVDFSQAGASLSLTIGGDASVTGSVTGAVTATLSGARSASTGATQNVAGFYQAGASNSAAVGYVIAGAASQAFAFVQSGASADAGQGAVNNAGQIAVATGRSTFTGTITPGTGVFTLTAAGAISASLSGASEAVLATQRLANISSRARVGAGSAVAIAGFVISGYESKPVLIRAVGPTLGAAPFNVPGILAAPKLDVHRTDAGNALVATNSGVGTGAGRAAIDAAGVAAGAFALGSAGADAAILTTLSPGNYTATVSSAGAGTGIALIEVYDLSAPAAGQKLFNISTRAEAGTGANALVAGVVVTGQVSKRVLIRGVGPGLGAFGLTGTLPAPTLALVNTQTGATVATNTGLSNSADSAAITAASAAVGAFPLAAGDSALIVSLPPGNYTAQVSNAAGAVGLALIEVYELP